MRACSCFIRGRAAAATLAAAVLAALAGEVAAAGETSAPTVVGPATMAEFREKLGAGAVAPALGSSRLPVAWGDGRHYEFGGFTWAPAPVGAKGAAAAGPGLATTHDPDFFIGITNAPRTAGPGAFTEGIHLGGACAGTTGDFVLENRSQRSSLAFAAQSETDWSVRFTNLVEGCNRIGVIGQDAGGTRVSDAAVIWVGERYVSVPAVGFDEPAFTRVSNGVTSVALAITNNAFVRGDIAWYNAGTRQRGLAATGVVGEAAWTFAVSNLDLGRNPIYVLASNRFGDATLDLVHVIRAERPGAARVSVTNWPPAVLSDAAAQAPLSGTHTNVQGSLRWSVRETDTVGFFAPGTDGRWATSVPVAPGTNTVTVYGRDAGGGYDADEVTVLVGGPRYTTPAAIGITNANPTVVPFAVTAVELVATTATPLVRSLVWTNYDAGTGGPMAYSAASPRCSATVSNLAVGPNEFYVLLENTYGNRGDAHVTVAREPRADLPSIAVTNAPFAVPYATVQVTIAGTNNPYVAGPIAWSNEATGARGEWPRDGAAWSGIVDGLVVGENVVHVFARNASGDRARDLASISRLPPSERPFLSITSEVPETVAYGVDGLALHGTNNQHVVPPLWWVNDAVPATGSVERTGAATWSCAVTGLVRGMNVLYVVGSNALGEAASAAVSVYRETTPGFPVVRRTNDVPSAVDCDTPAVALSGTNNLFVAGDMWWVNETAGLTGALARAGAAWAGSVGPLAVGMNVIYVYGTNAIGQQGADVVSVERLRAAGSPAIDITNAPAERVAHTVAAWRVSGTNSPDVVGVLAWENPMAETSGSFPVPANGRWSFVVSGLAHGINNIYVEGADAYGNEAGDVVSVFRAYPPWTRYVAPGGGNQAPYTNWTMAARTLQQAVDAASDGDLVLVAGGDYATGSRVATGEQTQSRVTVAKRVRVEGVGGPGQTVLRGGWDGGLNAVRCARVSDGGVLAGFSLLDGRAESFLSPGDGNGGGALIDGGGLVNCRVAGNHAANAGGGVFAGPGSSVLGCTLVDNDALRGGGACIEGAGLAGCTVISNTAPSGGGVSAMEAAVCDSRILANTAPGGASQGGGIALELKSALTNCVVAGNVSYGVGGGLSVGEGCAMVHCTVADNEAAQGGGGIQSLGPSLLRSSILRGNRLLSGDDAEIDGPGLDLQQCLLPFALAGNAVGQPLFAAPARFDYRLQAGSDGIDMLQAADAAWDLDALPRPLDGNADGAVLADAGAYEFLNALADSDGDRMPDGWEWDNGLDPASARGDDGARGDPDGDGMPNEDEYGADTRAHDPDSVLAIRAVALAGGDLHVTVQGGVHAIRSLETRPSLTATGEVWSVVDESPSPSPPTNVLVHAAPPAARTIYRIRATRVEPGGGN